MNGALLLVLTTPVAGKETDFEQWCVNKHIPDVLSSRRFRAANLYRATDVPTLPGVTVSDRSYVTVYEVDAASAAECDDAAEGLRELLVSGGTDLSDSLDPALMTSTFILPVA